MIALIGRARTLWAIAAPVARPLIASAVIGWGLATLGTMADERRENLADLDGEVAARLGELQQYHRDLAAAEQLAHDYSRELARLRTQLEQARADVKSGTDEGTPQEQPATVPPVPRWVQTERDRDRLIATGFMCGRCNAATDPGGGGTHAVDCPALMTPARPADLTRADDALPAATEPGCQHEACVLIHPHAGPAYLTPEAAERDGLGDAIDWERLTAPATQSWDGCIHVGCDQAEPHEHVSMAAAP